MRGKGFNFSFHIIHKIKKYDSLYIYMIIWREPGLHLFSKRITFHDKFFFLSLYKVFKHFFFSCVCDSSWDSAIVVCMYVLCRDYQEVLKWEWVWFVGVEFVRTLVSSPKRNVCFFTIHLELWTLTLTRRGIKGRTPSITQISPTWRWRCDRWARFSRDGGMERVKGSSS